MEKVQDVDLFVSAEPDVEVSAETHRILDERIQSASEGRLIPAAAARKRIQQWLSKSSTTKTR